MNLKKGSVASMISKSRFLLDFVRFRGQFWGPKITEKSIKKQVEKGEVILSWRLHFFKPEKNLKALPEKAYQHWDEELATH